jgi:hypothetical protein
MWASVNTPHKWGAGTDATFWKSEADPSLHSGPLGGIPTYDFMGKKWQNHIVQSINRLNSGSALLFISK